MPCSAPLPVPAIIATGVARPSAQGQDTTSTDMPMDNANSGVCPTMSQTMAETTAIVITIGTNTPATLSARRAMGALLAAASSTRRIMPERVVSSPTRSAAKYMLPAPFMVPEYTLSPGCLYTGMLSPVRADSSTLLPPEVMQPSTGMRWPGFTRIISPMDKSFT